MAYNGGLMYFWNPTTEGYDDFPLCWVYKESYKVTPNRRQDLSSTRNADGILERNVLSHTASTIELQTPPTWEKTIAELMMFLRSHYTNEDEKKVYIKYYCPDIDGYNEGYFYVPDIEFNISRVMENHIFYKSVTIEFIEY